MFDPEDLPLTTTEGRRPASTAGDRMMVGLAALALVGGALIAIGKVLPQGEAPQTSEATATAEPTVAASRTPRPTPTPRPLRSFQVEPGSPPDAQPQQPGYGGWVRALEDVSIRGSANPDSIEMEVLHAGDAAWVDEIPEAQGGTPGWFQVQVPVRGWVPVEIDGRAVLRLFPWTTQGAGWIEAVVSGSDGFALVGYSPQAGAEQERVLATSDGRSWQKSKPPFEGGYYGTFLANGPAGWLAMAHVEDGSGGAEPWLWQSADAATWHPLGNLSSIEDGSGGFAQLVANESGYVMLTNSGRGYGQDGATIWYSTDGVLWSERRTPEGFSDAYAARLTATPLGFFLHHSLDSGAWPGDGSSPGAFSPDGWTWSAMSSDGELQGMVGVAAAGELLVGVDRTEAGDARAWVGTVTGEEVAWSRDTGAGSAFDGAVLTAIVSDGTTPVAFGWERGTDEPLWWMRSGDAWQRHRLPRDYYGIPRLAAGGPAGYLLVGSSPAALGDNPTLWSLSSRGVWQVQTTTLIDPVANPSEQDCASFTNDLIELMRNSRMRIACFGDAPVTIRAYSMACEGCSYEYPGTADPEWLVQPTEANRLYLSPAEGEGWEYLEAVLAPSLELNPRWTDRWLEVTGHFDDPASGSCRRIPPPEEEYWYGGRQSVIDECRNRFVVTKVRIAG